MYLRLRIIAFGHHAKPDLFSYMAMPTSVILSLELEMPEFEFMLSCLLVGKEYTSWFLRLRFVFVKYGNE